MGIFNNLILSDVEFAERKNRYFILPTLKSELFDVNIFGDVLYAENLEHSLDFQPTLVLLSIQAVSENNAKFSFAQVTKSLISLGIISDVFLR